VKRQHATLFLAPSLGSRAKSLGGFGGATVLPAGAIAIPVASQVPLRVPVLLRAGLVQHIVQVDHLSRV